jgi:hypothetical protein
MKTQIIAETWDALSPNQTEFVESFYQRFFERFPAYRVLFTHKLDARPLGSGCRPGLERRFRQGAHPIDARRRCGPLSLA